MIAINKALGKRPAGATLLGACGVPAFQLMRERNAISGSVIGNRFAGQAVDERAIGGHKHRPGKSLRRKRRPLVPLPGIHHKGHGGAFELLQGAGVERVGLRQRRGD